MSEKLKRELGLAEVTLSGLGLILGAGVYALMGEAAALAGNSVWLSFGLAAVVAVFTALSYAELASMYPRAGAEYEYSLKAFGSRWAFLVGYMIITSGFIGSATVALGFAGYLEALTGLPQIPSAMVLIAILSLIITTGIRQSALVAMCFTLIEAVGLVLIILIGIPHWGSVNYLEMPHGLPGVLQGAALVFFSFLGFEEMVKLSEETVDPERNIPRALMLSIAGAILLYVAVSLSAVSVMDWRQLSTSSAPFADIAGLALGKWASTVVGTIALFATFNTVLLMLLAASRITYGMADSGALPVSLASVNPITGTPHRATLAVGGLSLAFIFLGDIALVANVTNFVLYLTFTVINAALIRLRFSSPLYPRPFRIPGNLGPLPLLPLVGIATSLFMMTQMEPEVLALGLAIMLVGIVITFVSKWAGKMELHN